MSQGGEHLLRDAPTLIRTVEDLLSRRTPPPSRFWAGSGSGDNDSFELVRWETMEYRMLSYRGGEYVESTDNEITAKDPDFRSKALLDAMEEVLLLGRRLFDDKDPPGDYIPIHNVHLLDDIRATFRRHLTRLLAAWYSLEGVA